MWFSTCLTRQEMILPVSGRVSNIKVLLKIHTGRDAEMQILNVVDQLGCAQPQLSHDTVQTNKFMLKRFISRANQEKQR